MEHKIKNAPLLSVVIPCYNYGHLVHETLESLKQQTYENWECIMINDGSSDNTEEVLLKFTASDSRFKYFFQENSGMSVARNRGIQYASGKYIQLLDSDDLLEPKKFEEQIAYLEGNPSTDIVYGDVKYFYSHAPNIFYKTVTATQQEWMPRVSGSGDIIIRSLIQSNIMAINCPIIRKEVFLNAGAFNTKLRHIEDWEMFLRWALHGVSFQYLEKSQTDALVRIHSISASQDKWSMRYHELELKESLSFHTINLVSTKPLDYDIDKLRVSLVLLTLLNLLKGNFGMGLHQYKQLRKKFAITDLRKNLGKIIWEKLQLRLVRR